MDKVTPAVPAPIAQCASRAAPDCAANLSGTPATTRESPATDDTSKTTTSSGNRLQGC